MRTLGKRHIIILFSILASCGILLTSCSNAELEVSANVSSTVSEQETDITSEHTESDTADVLSEDAANPSSEEDSEHTESDAAAVSSEGEATPASEENSEHTESAAVVSSKTEAAPASAENTNPVTLPDIVITEELSQTMYSSGSVNVRSGDSVNYAPIGSLHQGEKVTVTGRTSSGWYRIDYNGGVGYVSNKYLQENAPQAVSTQTTPSESGSSNSGTVTFTTSKGFQGEIRNGVTYIDGYLIANKTYSLPKTYGNGLTGETQSAFNTMKAAAAKDGLNIYISSGFRSYSYQQSLYNKYVNRDGAAAADTYSARAGYSEHQSGLAFDVNIASTSFIGTPEAIWLAANCYQYGFILRYPQGKTNETGYIYEPWHFRYVGVELAATLYNGGDWITMEDYFGITSQYQ